MKKLIAMTLNAWLFSHALFAQGSVDDYQRAFSLRDKFKDKVYYSNVEPKWIGKTNKFWYIRNTPQGKIYVVVDAAKKSRTELFDHQKLAKQLASASGKTVDANKLPIQSLSVNPALD